MKQNVTLKLSSGGTLSYDVGDKSYSSTCDYMKKCQFVCKPTKEIKDTDVKLDTYNEQFILMNTDKIVHKIRSLMKERFFYKKVDLIKFINAIKKYPLVQINAALDKLVEDQNEYITDKYNRTCNLINIGEMYLFQPLELNNKNSSLYDRSVPIEFKHDQLNMNLQEASVAVATTQPLAAAQPLAIQPLAIQPLATTQTQALAEQKQTSEFIKLVKEMREKYELASIAIPTKRGEDNWYKFCGMVINDLESSGISNKNDLLDILTAHIVDELSFENRLLLMNSLDNIADSEFGKRIKTYINKDVITNKGVIGSLLNNNGSHQLFIKTPVDATEYVWTLATAEDKIDLQPQLAAIVNKFFPIKDKLNQLTGFMINFKKDYIIFKVKDLTKKRHKGARCDQSGKKEAIKILNAIIGEEKYSNDSEINQKQVCVLQEFILRLYNKEKKNGLHWFLTPAEATLIDIEKISF